MSQQKAASLTSSLFARKGRASPASLVISELESDTPSGSAEAPPQHLHAAHEGEAMKLSALALNGHAGRRKARESEGELPLLAYVEARVAAEAAPDAATEAPAEASGGTPAGDAGTAAEAAEGEAPAGERPPAASLLDRGARALRKTNGRRATGGEAVPAGTAPSLPEAPAVEAAQPAVEPTGAAAPATVSGDDNVTAIVDAPEEAAPQSPEKDAAAQSAVVVEPAAGEAVAAQDSGAIVVEPEGGAQAAASTPPQAQDDTAGENPAPRGETEDVKPAAPALEPQAAGDNANSATRALRKAAAPRIDPAGPAAGRAAAVPAPPPVAEKTLPWRSAAVIALGAALGLGAYVMLSGPAEDAPVEVATEAAAPPAGEAASAPAGETANEAAPDVPVQAAAPLEMAAPLPEPSFDIIRIEPDGQSIIAGRAVPFSAWILLNNGEPIASIRADANGEWVVLPDSSLVPGANAFSLVPKTEQGRVAIPAPAAPPAAPEAVAPSGDTPAAPRAGRGDGGAAVEAGAQRNAGIALPKPKPAAPARDFRASAAGSYQVQVASVRASADAERERRRLLQAYPQLLGSLELQVQTAAVEGAGTFYRVRSGAMADLGDAREVCRRLEAAGQGCLVVRRAPAAASAPEAEPSTEVVDDAVPKARSPAPQQAERPQ